MAILPRSLYKILLASRLARNKVIVCSAHGPANDEDASEKEPTRRATLELASGNRVLRVADKNLKRLVGGGKGDDYVGLVEEQRRRLFCKGMISIEEGY
mgnify:CR=1 FL=1